MQCRMDKKNLLAPQNLIGEAIISLHVAYTCTARAQSFKTEDFFINRHLFLRNSRYSMLSTGCKLRSFRMEIKEFF